MSGKTSGKILTLVQENKNITIPELSEKIGVAERTIERNIQKLKDQNLLRREGSAKDGYWESLK